MARLQILNSQTDRTRRARSRLYIAAFWTLAAAVHLNAGQDTDVRFLLLVAMALLAGATALLLRWASDETRPATGSYRVANQITLLRHLEEEIARSRRGKTATGLMLATPAFLMHEADERKDNRRLMTRAVEELIKHYKEPDAAVFRLDDGVLAVALSAADAVNHLEDMADRLQADVRGWRAAGPGPGSIQLNFGVAEAAGATRSAEELLRRARSALERAESLGTGRYISVDEGSSARRRGAS